MNEPAERSGDRAERPVVASYCATFLKPEMLHIYRQITALKRWRPVVLARKREGAERFPFSEITLVPKGRGHFLRRIWFRQIRHAPWPISSGERRALRAALDRCGAQLLHIYFGHIAVHLLPLIQSWPRPTVVSFHGADVMVELDRPAYRAATLRMLDAVRLVLVRSESLARVLVELGCAPGKIRVQRTGIPLAQFPFRERTPAENGAWRLLQACRLIEKKGLRTSLRAFAQFGREFPQATFTIAGEGSLLAELRAEAERLGISGRVIFAGLQTQEELGRTIYASHLFLHPSETGADGNQEGVPNSMLEAMASGLPVFATPHGGIPEAIIHGASGILVPEGDADALASALLSAAHNPERLGILARAGAEAVTEKFEQRAQVRRLEEIYFEAIGASA